MPSEGVQRFVRTTGRLLEHAPKWVFDLKIQMALDATAAAAACVAALLIRFGFQPARSFTGFVFWIPILAVGRPLLLLLRKAYLCTWRHFHLADGLQLASESSLISIALIGFRVGHGFGLHLRPLPYSVVIIELALFVTFAGWMRILRRLTYSAIHPFNEPVYRTLLISDDSSIAGAVRLVEPYPDVQLVGIISEDHKIHGHTIAGVPVLGGVNSLQTLIVANEAELVLITSGSAHPTEDIIKAASDLGIQVRVLPTARDLVRDRVRVSNALRIEEVINKLRQFDAEPHPEVVACLHERCVLVTGAGGSIGSEIARQLAFLPISKLIILDQDENSIFELTNELACTCAEIVPCVGDIRDSGLLEELFSLHEPDVVLHAAAYKHVPVMEANPCEAILNNVTGTRMLVETAERFNCERFVMISTDKAVRPSSVMGATKRVAEIVIQDRARASASRSKTQFACVRFGNVLGSRGSVVPIFLRQIAAGGPVTITHEEMTRYFMSIPQAVHLVLQAATLASTGDVYMLDMGDPVKIIEFARALIRMSGLRPDIDIPIQITGTRPGEKLHEQLWYEDSEVTKTSLSYVYRVKARTLPRETSSQIARLEKAAEHRASNNEVYDLLQSLPIDYVRTRTVMAIRPAVSAEPHSAAASGGAD